MTDELAKIDTLISTSLKLRTALSVTLVALADIEGAETIEAAKLRAKTARTAARDALRNPAADDAH